MKHGLNTEVHAKAKSEHIFKKLHKICVFKNPRMKIWEGFPFIYVIPDLGNYCECHGEDIVKIKCPATFTGKIPIYENY